MTRVSAVVAERRFKINLEMGKHLMLLGNLAAGALIFGQTFSGAPFDPGVAIVGILVMIGLYGLAVYLMKGGAR